MLLSLRCCAALATITLLAPAAYAQRIQQTAGPPFAELRSVLELDDGVLASGALSGLFHQQDGAWSTIPTGASYGTLFRFGDAIFAHSNYLFARSTDEGTTWAPTLDVSVALPDVTDDSLYALRTSDGSGLLYASGDGVTWRSRPLMGMLVDDDGHPTGDTFSGAYALAFGADGSWWAAAFGANTFGPFRSEDGERWRVANDGLNDSFPLDLIAAGGEVFVTGTSGGARRWDGATEAWVLDEGGPVEQVGAAAVVEAGGEAYLNTFEEGGRSVHRWDPSGWEAVAMPNANAVIAGGQGEQVYAVDTEAAYVRSMDGEWTPITDGLVAGYAIPMSFREGAVMASTRNGLHVSDDGATWTRLQTPNRVDRVYPFESVWIGTSYDEVYRSVDGGETWEVASGGINPGVFHEPRLTDVVEADGALYASLLSSRSIEHQGAEVIGGIYRSSDDGGSWTLLASGYPFSSGLRAGARALTVTEQSVFAVTMVGIRRLEIGASQWQEVLTPGQADNVVRDLIPTESGLVAVTNSGLFVSLNEGQAWAELGGGLPDDFIWNFSLFTADESLFALYRPFEGDPRLYEYAGGAWTLLPIAVPEWVVWNRGEVAGEFAFFGTHNHGIWSVPLIDLAPVSNEGGNAITGPARLGPIYPNPVRNRATLRISQPTTAPVRAELFDVLGRRVQLFHDGVLGPEASLELDARGLAPGLYVVRLRGEALLLTQRFTVVQ